MSPVLEVSRTQMNENCKPGIRAARVLRSLAAGGGNIEHARAFASQEYGADRATTKALAAGDAVGGGFLLAQDMADEVIDLLRPMSVVRAIEPQIVRPNRGSIEFPKLTSGASAGYVGENADIPVSEQEFGQVIFVAKKLAALVPISNDLLKFGSPSADAIIRDDMVQAIATAEDQNLLRGDGLEDKPKGLRFQAASANVTASNGTTSDDIEADFKDLINGLEVSDVKLVRPAWLMNPRSKNHLLNLRDANGNLIYPEIRSTRPTIYGWPVFVSTNIPINLGAGNESEIFFVDAAEVIFGEVDMVEVAVSSDGAYLDSTGTMRSAFTRDQTLMRAILRHDINVKHDVGVAVKTGVTWGA